MIGICVRLKFENVNYSSEINHADAQTGLWFYYIITKIHPPFQNPGSAPEVLKGQTKGRTGNKIDTILVTLQNGPQSRGG